jgi:hypothetical protein
MMKIAAMEDKDALAALEEIAATPSGRQILNL